MIREARFLPIRDQSSVRVASVRSNIASAWRSNIASTRSNSYTCAVWKMGLAIAAIALSQVAAAESLSITQAVDEAFQTSPQIQMADSKSKEAGWRKTGSYAGILPTLNFGATHNFEQKFQTVQISLGGGPPILFPEIGPTTIYSLNANLPLFDGFANYRRLDASRSFASAAQDDADWSKFQVGRQVMLQFYRALAAKTLQEVAENNVKVLEDHQHDVTQFRKAGVSTNYDVLRVEVQVNEARSELMNSADNGELAKTQLTALMGRDDDSRVLVGELPVLKKEIVNLASLNSLEERKDINSMQKYSQAMDQMADASGRYLIPHLDLQGSYQLYNNTNSNAFDADVTRNAYSVGVSLTWNIFDGMASISKSRVAGEQKYQSEKSLRAANLKAKQDLSVWKRKYAYFCDFYHARLSDIEKSKESVRLAKEGRRAGIRTNTDLLDAEADLYRSQAGAVNAQIGAIEALINLELTTGRKLFDFK